MVKVFCDDCGKEVYMPKYYGEVDMATYVRNAEMYDGIRFYYDAKTNTCLDLCEQCMQKRRVLNDLRLPDVYKEDKPLVLSDDY